MTFREGLCGSLVHAGEFLEFAHQGEQMKGTIEKTVGQKSQSELVIFLKVFIIAGLIATAIVSAFWAFWIFLFSFNHVPTFWGIHRFWFDIIPVFFWVGLTSWIIFIAWEDYIDHRFLCGVSLSRYLKDAKDYWVIFPVIVISFVVSIFFTFAVGIALYLVVCVVMTIVACIVKFIIHCVNFMRRKMFHKNQRKEGKDYGHARVSVNTGKRK